MCCPRRISRNVVLPDKEGPMIAQFSFIRGQEGIENVKPGNNERFEEVFWVS